MQEEHKRILVPARDFALHPINTVKSLIGLDVEIKSVKQNEVFREDGLLLVDVLYLSLDLNPIIIHFIKKEDLKPISPYSQDYGIKINDLNVLVDMKGIDKDKFIDYYPIQIMRKDFIENKRYFQYYGTITSKPLGYLCTPLISKNRWELPMPKKLYPDGFSPKESITKEIMMNFYKYEIAKLKLVSKIKNVVYVSKFEDCKSDLDAYLIKWEEIQKQDIIQGIIMLQPKRIYDVVLYIPTQMFMISKDDINSITSFIEFSKVNWLNYCYITRKQ